MLIILSMCYHSLLVIVYVHGHNICMKKKIISQSNKQTTTKKTNKQNKTKQKQKTNKTNKKNFIKQYLLRLCNNQEF